MVQDVLGEEVDRRHGHDEGPRMDRRARDPDEPVDEQDLKIEKRLMTLSNYEAGFKNIFVPTFQLNYYYCYYFV